VPLRPALTILDPTSLLGRDVTETVAKAFPELTLRLFHTSGGTEHQISECGGQAAIVPPLVGPNELEGSLAVIVTRALEPAIAKRLTDFLAGEPRVALIDCSTPGVAPKECVRVFASLPRAQHRRHWYQLVDPGLAASASFLQAALPLAPRAFAGTLFAPASSHGEEAVQELAQQATARLSGWDPRRPRHLPKVTAFDITTAAAVRSENFARQLRALHPDLDVALTVFDVGVFYGNFATVRLTLHEPTRLENARSTLTAKPGFRFLRRGQKASLSDIIGQRDVVCGDLKVAGNNVSAWLFADGLKMCGAQAVADLLSYLTAS
jgi:hypothetical protein